MFNHKILALYDPGRDWPSFFRMSVLIQVYSAWGITKENSCISLRRFAVSHHPYDSIQKKVKRKRGVSKLEMSVKFCSAGRNYISVFSPRQEYGIQHNTLLAIVSSAFL